MEDFKEQDQVEISLSFFDLILGPRIIAALPWVNEKKENNFIDEYFDFHNPNDFFTHIYAKILSFNFLFQIKNPENVRNGKRLFMLTASIPFSIFQKKDILQYYTSIEQIFKDWGKNLANLKNLNKMVIDGKIKSKMNKNNNNKPILKKLAKYLSELQFLIQVLPETKFYPI